MHQADGKRRICVIGGGSWGENHIRTLYAMGSLGGIVESDSARLKSLLLKYPAINGFSSLEDALTFGYDGYIVATPAETHYEIGKKLLEKDQNVLIEKPLSLCSSDSLELVRLAEEHRSRLMVGHLMLFHPAIIKIKELVEEGTVGDLRYIYSNRLNLGKVRTEENALWSLAPHDISILNYLTGKLPDTIKATGGCFLQKGIHDTVLASYSYPDNIQAHIFVSWLHPFKEHRITIVGSKAMLVYEDSSAEKKILYYDSGVEVTNGKPVKREKPAEVIAYEPSSPLENELKYFIEHLDSEIAVSDGTSGHEVVSILEKTDGCLRSCPEKPYFVHESAYVDEGVDIGEGTSIWYFSHVQKGANIGKNCTIGQNVNIGNNVIIGSHVKIQNNVSVYEGVELEDYVFCGPSMVFTNIKNPRCKYPQKGSDYYVKTLVREGASIGANATIVCGHTIGKHALIGAGAVVASDVPDYALMIGVPAKRRGWVCECGEQLGEGLICRICGRAYKEENEILNEVSKVD